MIPTWLFDLMAEERARAPPRGPTREDLDDLYEHSPAGDKELAFPGHQDFDEVTGEYKL